MKNKKNQKKEEEEVIYDDENVSEIKSSFSNISVEKLKTKIKDLEIEKKEYLNGWQRAQADIVNLKKNHQDEKKLFTQIGKQSLLEEIIPVLDNFDAAFSNKDAWEKTPKEWRVGIEYIYNQFIGILNNNHVEQFGEVGDDFNEELHLSLGNIKTDKDKEKEKIAVVLQRGYKIKDKILREAKVKIFI